MTIKGLRDRYTAVVDGPHVDLAYWGHKQGARHAVFLHFSSLVPLHIPAHLLPSTQQAWMHAYQPDAAVAALLAVARNGEIGGRNA